MALAAMERHTMALVAMERGSLHTGSHGEVCRTLELAQIRREGVVGLLNLSYLCVHSHLLLPLSVSIIIVDEYLFFSHHVKIDQHDNN